MTSSTTRAFVAKKPFATASAFMAKTNQLLSTMASLRLLLVMFLTLTVSAKVWGADYSKNESWNFGKTGNTNWSGHNSDYCGACGSKNVFNVYKTNITNFSNIDFSKYENVSLTIYVKAGTNSGTNSYTVKLIDANGNQVSTYTSTKTNGMGNGTNSSSAKESSVSFNPTTSFNGYKIEFPAKAYITQTRYVLTYDDKVAAHTVTWTINPAAGGILSAPSGNTTTVTPNAAYTYANPAYTVTPAGKASVVQNNNDFTATPSASCTIQINMVEKQKHTITWMSNGVQYGEKRTVVDGQAIGVLPDTPPACSAKYSTFVGWYTLPSGSETTPSNSPQGVKVTESTIPNENATYYAVWADGSGSGGEHKRVTLDFSTNSWNLPNGNSNKVSSTTEKSYTSGDYTIKLAGDGSNGFYYNSNQLLLGKNGAYMKLPAFSFKVSKIVSVKPSGTVSGRVTWNVFSGSTEVSTALTGCTDECTFAINENYQDIGTIYMIKVTNANNLQIKQLEIYESVSGATGYITTCSAQPSPSLSADETELAFGNVTVNSPQQLTFTLSGSDLTANATLAISGTNEEMFSVSPTPVTPSNGSITNQTITVTYQPTDKGNHYATLTISSEGADNVTVSLSGTGIAQTAEYTVEHYQQNIVDDGYTLYETETSYGEVDASVTPAVKSYEGFAAPSTTEVTIAAGGSTVVEYLYTRNSYTLTWDVNDGNDLTGTYTSGSVKYGATITKPADPTRESYHFNGWHNGTLIVTPATTMPANNLTYTAQWTKKHTIKWVVNGDTDTPYETTYVVGEDALDFPSAPNAPSTCEEKVFIGWTESASVNADGSDIEYVDENTKPNTDKTYYAVFASPDANGAGGDYKKVTSELSDWSGEYLIVYEARNIAFDGWQEQENLNDGYHISVTIEDDAIAATTEMDNARFTVAKMTGGYSVKSASGYYIGCTSSDKGLYSSQDIQYLNQISWGKPWDSAAEGVIIRSQNNPILLYSTTAERFRYYSSAQEPIALYRKSSYTDYTTVCVETFKVTYDANGATSGNVPVDENNYISGATVTVLGNTGNLQKTHYSFVGWNTQADGNGRTSYPAGETFTITEDVTLYAIWEDLPQYSVIWYVNGKQLTDIELSGASTTVYEGDRITKTPPAPNPEDFCGQVFVGWTDAEMDVNNTDKPTIYNLVDEFPTASGNQNFYAVFADYDEQQ